MQFLHCILKQHLNKWYTLVPLVSCCKNCFSSEIHFDIEYHMAFYLLKSNQARLFLWSDLLWCAVVHGSVWHTHFGHLFLDGYLPEVISTLLIDLQCLSNLFGDPNSKLMSGCPILLLDFFNDYISFSGHKSIPPLEVMILVNLICDRIFS